MIHITNTAFNAVFDRGCIIYLKNKVNLTIISIQMVGN